MELHEQRMVLETFLESFGIEISITARMSHLGRKFSAHFPEIVAVVNPEGKQWYQGMILMLANYVQGLDPEDYKLATPIPSPKKLKRRSKTQEFLLTWEWKKLRMDALKRYGFRCQCCGAEPSQRNNAGVNVRIEVDHIKPISKFWHLRSDPNNLQVLCRDCNKGKSNRYVDDFR